MTDKKSLLEKYSKHLSREEVPTWVEPMLAILTKDYFDDPDWIYERKLDGERCLAYKTDKVTLFSRNKNELNSVYPELVEALSNQKGEFILDGEIVSFDGNITSFSKLQKRMHIRDTKEITETDIKVFYYIFDILHIDGYNTRDLRLRDRKKILKNMISFHDPLRYTIHRNEKGIAYHKEACQKGWEGIMAKDSEGKYLSTRSKEWLKFKCRNQQEFVIGGFTDPEGERMGFGALLIGYYESGKLLYAGKVGTGYNDEILANLSKQLRGLEIEDNPYSEEVDEKNVHWVKPKLVCEVKFAEWTKNDKLRHPAFVGLRYDKPAKQVVMEKPVDG